MTQKNHILKYQVRNIDELNELRFSSISEIEEIRARIKGTITEAASILQDESRKQKNKNKNIGLIKLVKMQQETAMLADHERYRLRERQT